jgi:2-amino-4-hydroxy-6-hydroxymethyldihydropteridine diphosphokinase
MSDTQLTYHLLLGANMEEPELIIKRAVSMISELPDCQMIKLSSLQRTKPYGKTDQEDFYNQVIQIRSPIEPSDMMQALLDIESRLGRVRKERWGARIIDIDILLIEDKVIDTSVLKVPHYDLHNRAFALELICEIAPDAVHPIYQKTMHELLMQAQIHGGKQ